MALNWDAKKVANWEELANDDTERMKTEVIVFATMMVHFGEITTKNYEEFYDRMLVARGLFEQSADWYTMEKKSPRSKELVRVDHFITLEDIRRRIGLRTNVSNKSRKGFGSIVAGWLDNREKERAYQKRREERARAEETIQSASDTAKVRADQRAFIADSVSESK